MKFNRLAINNLEAEFENVFSPSLAELDLSGSNLAGTFPENVPDQFPNLKVLALAQNPRLQGTIPESYCRLDQLGACVLFEFWMIVVA